MVSTTGVALSIVFPILAILAVCGRFYSRRVKGVGIKADDWIIIPGLLCGVGTGILGLIGVYAGDVGVAQPKGPNGYAILSPNFVTFEKVIYAGTLLFVVCLCCARLSILLFYRRIFVGNLFIKILWANFALQAFWGVAWLFTYAFQCVPASEIWAAALGQRKHCWDGRANFGYAISNVLMDILVLVMPQTVIWKLQMSFRQKLAVSGIFLMGAIVIAMGIGKTVAYYNVTAQIMSDHDTTYDEAGLIYWSVAEGNLAIVCACLPTLRPAFKGLSPESVMRSIRSVISLGSLDSKGHRRHRTAVTSASHTGQPHSESVTRINNPSFESASHRIPSKESREGSVEQPVPAVPSPYDAQIHVQREYQIKHEGY